MPIYEYQCRKCQHRFERIQKFSEPPVRKCPKCGGPVEQLLHAPAVQFKGAGWYVTDYASKGTSKSDGAAKSGEETPAESKAEAGSPAKDEKKPTARKKK
jgi:putative FmdB family regulatory protein